MMRSVALRFVGALCALTLPIAAAIAPTALLAQSGAAATGVDASPSAPCALTGSVNVFVEGKAMLTLGDVAGCPGIRYEIIPNVMINGEPAVRILPQDDCAPAGANSVRTSDGAAGIAGANCQSGQ